jgi:DNA repair protein RecN (Recombination protein N)
MLRSLHISNYALIDKLEIEFYKRLTTITGETGAGKSILLGALSLILGARADTQVLKNKENKCVVEGSFDHIDSLLSDIFNENDIEREEILILRREISPNGKSRAFVNDTPVNLPVLRDIGLKLVDIHSQHENLELNNNIYQLMVVDAFAGISLQIQEYQGQYFSMKQTMREITDLKVRSEKAKSELDFFIFQFTELDNARLNPGEQEEMEDELKSLKHAEEIKTGLFNAWLTISGDENNVLTLLKSAESELMKIKGFHRASEELQARIESIIIELKDLAVETENLSEKTALDPDRLEWVEGRLNLLYSLQQKHRLKTVNELIELRNDLAARIDHLGSLEFTMEALEKEHAAKKEQVIASAKRISDLREKCIPEISKRIVEILVQLGIPNAQFSIVNEKSFEPGENGFDNVRFLFTANRKTELQDITRIASGGELSRLMLGIKYIISGSLGLPTIIFDEIDTGVSGEIAFKVGGIMKEMSNDRQVFAITHLPQVAAKGDQHYMVYKDETDTGTNTRIRILDIGERIVEIAKMLSGEQTTGAAIENARELLGWEK